MAEYLLYCFRGSQLMRAVRFDARDDEIAILKAMGLCDDGPGELWCGARKVEVFESTRF